MQNAQSRRSKTIVLTALVPFVIVASLVATAPSASGNHDTVDDVPRAETYRDPYPDSSSSGDWTKESHNCGLWGCGDDFWVTTTKGATARWNLPNLQGVYTFSRTLPKHFTPDKHAATGRVKWTIWEWRRGSTSYNRVATFTPVSQQDRLGWYTYNSHRIELDGAIAIIAEALDSGKRVGVQHVRLNHVDVLPEHLNLAKDMCVDGDDKIQNAVTRIAALTGVAVGVLLQLSAPGIGSAALVTALKAASVPAAVAWRAAEEIMELLTDREDRKERYCGIFHSTWWWQGYSKFADDIAELSNSANEYQTFGCTYVPTRRTSTSRGTAPCKQQATGAVG